MKTKTKKTRRATTPLIPVMSLPAATKKRVGQSAVDAHVKPADSQSSVDGSGQNSPDTLGARASPSAESSSIGSGGVHCPAVALECDDAPDPIARLRVLQVQRVHVLRTLIRLSNSVGGLARVFLRWESTMADADRKKINEAAAELVKAIEDGEPPTPEHAHIVPAIAGTVLNTKLAGEVFHKERKRLEKEMESLAESLPVYKSFVDPIRGFGPLGLAIIVGEAGDLSNYANPGKLWKRLGLAPDAAYRMTTSTGAEAIAKPRRRRSAMFTVGDSLVKGNGDGEYRKVYADRRAYEMANHPEFDKGIDPKTGKQRVSMHCHLRAQRYMEKRLLKHLWQAWRAAIQRKAA